MAIVLQEIDRDHVWFLVVSNIDYVTKSVILYADLARLQMRKRSDRIFYVNTKYVQNDYHPDLI